jgi:hypothetical protein
MSNDLVPAAALAPLGHADLTAVPALIQAAGDKATNRFIEFFTANIRNPNSRRAYAQAVTRFCKWCDANGLTLGQLTPFHVAAYIEGLCQRLATPSRYYVANRTGLPAASAEMLAKVARS